MAVIHAAHIEAVAALDELMFIRDQWKALQAPVPPVVESALVVGETALKNIASMTDSDDR